MPVYSQNGWVANDRRFVIQWTIPGTIRKISLEMGEGGFLLTHFAAWFDKNIEDIEADQLDDWGYAERPIRGSTTDLSNHASGTAIDLNAVKHPLGVTNTFTVAQRNAIRIKLLEYEDVIRWGGDYVGRKDDMHFEINASIAKTMQVAEKIRKGTTALPTKPVTKRRRDSVVDNNVILPGKGQQRFICPTGNGALVTERAFISAAVNGDRPGSVKFFFQNTTKGISNTEILPITVKGGVSTLPNREIPAGTAQVNVQYDFPDGGVVCIETLARA